MSVAKTAMLNDDSVPPLLMQAASSAAQADGLTPPKLAEGDNVDAAAALTAIGGGLAKKQKMSHEPVQQHQQHQQQQHQQQQPQQQQQQQPQPHAVVPAGNTALSVGNAALERARRAIA
eukprot:scaffold274190_cov67-Attheya_sp.AAC.3